MQDGLLQDLYFERKMAEFGEPWAINHGNGTKYNEIRKNTSLIHLASKERNSIPCFSLISGFYLFNVVVVSDFLLSIFRFFFLFDCGYHFLTIIMHVLIKNT